MPNPYQVPRDFNVVAGQHIAAIIDGKIAEIHPYPVKAIAGGLVQNVASAQSASNFNQQQQLEMKRLRKELEDKYEVVVVGVVDRDRNFTVE